MTVIGCSGSFPGPQSPASCYLVQAEDADGRTWSIVLDLGNGALGVLQRHLALDALDAVLLSHLHPDHCLDVCGLYVTRKYAPSRGADDGRLPVHGPRGVERRMAEAYGGGEGSALAGQLDYREWEARRPVRIGPFTVTPVPVNHPVEAYGLRVEADGQVLAYSGDTDSCPELSELFAGATLVLADSAFVDGRDDTRDIHLTGSRAAAAAVEAGGVQRLMLTHIPSWNDPQVCRAQAASVWTGEVELAEPERTYPL